MAIGAVELRTLTKYFGDSVAVDGINLNIEGGEFFSLLGPSGCGKTTTLRMIAGLEDPTSGRIVLDGVDVATVPAYKRNVHTVFQSYALFPHMDVFENIAFGLRRRKVPKNEMRDRVIEALNLVQLVRFERRRPNQLSGGQQQRVALARALVLHPAVLLLDEPLGALDARIRKSLRVELKALQEQVGITFVFVTHDQEEALTMSDRIAVMHDGRVEQVGSPKEVYETPHTAFVAEFLGVSNLMDAHVIASDGTSCRLQIGEFEVRAMCARAPARGPVQIVVRPERVTLTPMRDEERAPNALPGIVQRVVYAGSILQVLVQTATGKPMEVVITNTGAMDYLHQGTPVLTHLPADAVRILSSPETSAEN